jgi:heme-degrading monooxygenase HmoA
MFAVVFEVQPHPERWDDYLGLAKQLKPKLEAIDGFIDNERFASKRTEGRVLSLSTWRDEKAVIRWRTHGEHHGVQERGRNEVFADYRLRVGGVTSDTRPPAGARIVAERLDETEIGAAKAITITELTPRQGDSLGIAPDALPARLGLADAAVGLVDREMFESIYVPGKLVLLVSWRDAGAAAAWSLADPGGTIAVRHRHVRVVRDYGMFERREAPQFYPEASRTA